VHDLVAHSLAVTMLHLTGARLALADGETAEAQSALAAAERLGRSSMTGIRNAVGLLADADADVNWRPEPDAGDLAALVEDYRRAGVDVTLVRTGADDIAIDTGTGLALYRLLQESLANAVRHAPAQPISIRLDATPGRLELQVTNPVVAPAQRSDGHGLVGMRERAEQLGGRFDAGPSEAGWTVHAMLSPTADVEATTR
jgi:signal transduction histidine kinase